MYTVYIRQTWSGPEMLVHSGRSNDLKLPAGSVTLDVAAIPSFVFDIYPTNPGYNALRYHVTLIRVHDEINNRDVFEGRMMAPSEPLDQDGLTYKEVTCEGLASWLQDSVPGFIEFTGKTRLQILTALVDAHNKEMTDLGAPEKCFKLGNVSLGTATAPYCFTDDSATTYDNINNLVLAAGFELSVRHEPDGLYVDCAKSIGVTGSQVIELRKNLVSYTRDVDPSALVTVLKPLGQAAESSATTSTDKGTARLTIAKVNNGSPYLVNSDLVAEFGPIVGVYTDDDETNAANLMKSGQSYFNALTVATVTTQMQVVDLTILGRANDPFLCGWTYRVRIPFMGIDENMRIKQQTLDINDLSQNTLTMGDRAVGIEAYNASLAAQVAGLKLYSKRFDTVLSTAEASSKQIQDLANQQMALRATPAVKLSSGPGPLQLTYTITPARNITGEVSYTPEICADLNTWTAGTSTSELTGTFTVSEVGDYYVHVKATIGDYDSTWSQVARITVS